MVETIEKTVFLGSKKLGLRCLKVANQFLKSVKTRLGSCSSRLVDVVMGENLYIAPFVNAYGCRIGDNSRVGAFVEIQKNAVIGRNCKISSHTFVCEGVQIADNVFIGHNVTFINDKYPRATNDDGTLQREGDWKPVATIIEESASIGSGSVILCGVRIGRGAMVGAGSVVTHDVPDNVIVAGNPARILRNKDKVLT